MWSHINKKELVFNSISSSIDRINYFRRCSIKEHISILLAIPLLLLLGLGISWLIAFISYNLTRKRKEKKFMNWQNHINPIEAKIEAYGLGNMMGQVNDENNVFIPLDILMYYKEKTNLNIEELIKAYVTGLINGKKDYIKKSKS